MDTTAPLATSVAIDPPGHDDYPLGRTPSETERLVLQHHLYGPITREFLVAAGISAGMRVLDLGSGAGDVALTVADLVGPSGSVVGVDVNTDILRVARARADAAGHHETIRFVHGDVVDLDLRGHEFDAVVGRWILMYLADPADTLASIARLLEPGGIVAFLESDLRVGVDSFPPAPLHEAIRDLLTPPANLPGPDPAMGPRLLATYLRAGLPTPQLRIARPVGGGSGWPGFDLLAATVRSLLPHMVRLGIADPSTLGDVDTLADRLRAEVVERDGIQQLAPVHGAWSRVSTGDARRGPRPPSTTFTTSPTNDKEHLMTTQTTRTAADVVIASISAMEALDLDAIRATTHPEAVNREAAAEPPQCRQPGPAGVYATAEWLHNLADDITWDVHEVIVEGDLVAVHVTMRGHQSNPHTIYAPDGQPAQTMPNHGRSFAVTQTHWFRMRDGLVAEHWANRDDLGMALQLGWFAP